MDSFITFFGSDRQREEGVHHADNLKASLTNLISRTEKCQARLDTEDFGDDPREVLEYHQEQDRENIRLVSAAQFDYLVVADEHIAAYSI